MTVNEWISNTTLIMNELHSTMTASKKRSVASRELELNITKHDFSYSIPDVTLFDQSFDCAQNGDIPSFSASVDLSAGGSVDGAVTFGVAVSGNIFDIQNFELGLLVGLDSVVAATMNLDAELSVSPRHRLS